MIYPVMFVLVPTLLAILIWWNRRKGEVQVRWWAWPIMLASIPLSFPAHLTQAISDAEAWLPTMQHGYESTCLAPWISDVLYCCHWLQLFTWALGLVVVLRWEGMVFASPKAKRFFLGSVGAVMVPLCLFDALLLAILVLFTPIPWREVAKAASPDGRLLAIVYKCPSMEGYTYNVLCETNVWCPLFAKKLDTFSTYFECDSRSKGLAWSKDSRVVVLWSDNNPSRAYALPRRIELKSPGVPMLTNRVEIDRLMDEHGGPAP